MARRDADVLVVGAGAAGLMAADCLVADGIDVIVVEARERVGGRILTVRDGRSPVPLELGAEFVHGRAPETVRILDANGVAFYDVHGGELRARDGRLRPARSFWPRLEALMSRMDPAREPDRSFDEFLAAQGDVAASDRRTARAFVEGFHAADANRASERALAQAGGGGGSEVALQSARVAGGYDRVPAALAERLGGRVRTRTAVRRIEWRRGEVKTSVELGTGDVAQLATRACIVTLPVGVLAAQPPERGAVRFDPDPAPLRRALDGLAMGPVVRLSFLFDRRFWEDGLPAAQSDASLRELSFVHAPGRPFNVWWSAYPVRAPMLVAWSGGPPAAELERQGAAGIEAAATEELAAITGLGVDAVRARVVRCARHDWSADPYSRGAYSYAVSGGADAWRRLREPVEATLLYAGEAAARPGENGTVEGALESGRAAAVAVTAALGDGA